MPGKASLGDATLELRADGNKLRRDLGIAEKKTEQRLQKFGRRMSAGGFLLAGVGALAVAPLAIGIKRFAEFEQGMANVRAISGATQEEFLALESTAKRMGATTVFTATQSAGALSFMAMAGFEANEMIQALPHVLNLAAAGQIELAESADIVTNIMAGYGIAIEGVGYATDVLVAGFTSANTSLLQLGEAFKYAGPVAAAAGIQFEGAVSAIALMGNAGIQGSLAGTALRGALSKLLKPTGQGAEVIERLGLNIYDTEGNILDLVSVIRELERVGIGAGDALALFGLRAGPGMLALVRQGSHALEEHIAYLEQSEGLSQQIAEIQLDTFQGQITLLKSAVDGLAISIGQSLVPTVRPLIEGFAAGTQFITRFAERFGRLSTIVVITIAVLGGLTLATGLTLVAMGVLAASLGALGFKMSMVTGIATAMWAAILGPVGLIIAGVIALAGVFAFLYFKVDSVRRAVNSVLSAIWELGREAVRALSPLLGVLDKINSFLGGSGRTTSEIQSEMEALQKGPDSQMSFEDQLQLEADIEEALRAGNAELVKTMAPLVTGKTRWRTVELEVAQENAADRIIQAIDDQTAEWIKSQEHLLAGIPDYSAYQEKQARETLEALKKLAPPEGGGLIGDIFSALRDFDWSNLISPLWWKDFITNVLWGDFLVGLVWNDFLVGLVWNQFIKEILWNQFIKEILWNTWIKQILWNQFIKNILWNQFIKEILWGTFIKQILWQTYIKEIFWNTWIKGLVWNEFIKGMVWDQFIKPVIWDPFIKPLVWDPFIKPVIWETFIKRLWWDAYIQKFLWPVVIQKLWWNLYIERLFWGLFIKRIWWGLFIKQIIWGTFIKQVTWGFFIKQLAWGLFIKGLLWDTWVKQVIWPSFIRDLRWTAFIEGIRWSAFIPSLNWSSFMGGGSSTGSSPGGLWGKITDTIREGFKQTTRLPYLGEQGSGGIALQPALATVGDVPEAIIPLDQLSRYMEDREDNVRNVDDDTSEQAAEMNDHLARIEQLLKRRRQN